MPTSGGWTFEAQLEEDDHRMLSINSPNRVTGKRQGRYLLTAVLTLGGASLTARRRNGRCSRRTGSGVGGCNDPEMNYEAMGTAASLPSA